jgi:Tfp pilus assembly protein PilV
VITRFTRAANRCSTRSGLALVEMVISIVLVSVMLVAALNMVGASKLGQRKLHERLSGQQLAQDLMAEILSQDYADPEDGVDSFGLSSDESAAGDRSLFDDVDDYDGWSATPPELQDGTVMSDLDGWTRTVRVEWVRPTDTTQTVGSNEGAKLITVTVTHDGVPASELVALRTSGAPVTEACCLSDGTCIELAPDSCTALGGEPRGPATGCLTSNCATALEGTFRDEFNALDYAGDDGTLMWAGDWQEINEDDGPRRGDEIVAPDPLGGDPPPSTYQLRVRNANEGMVREADLTGAVSVTLSLLYRRGYLNDATQYVAIEVSANGTTGPWTEVARFEGPGPDATYQPFSQDISAYVAENFAIRFIGSPDMSKVKDVWFDDVEIECGP